MKNDKRKALGMGLEQLFNNQTMDINNLEKEIVDNTDESEIIELNINELRSNPYQPRKTFDDKKLEELSESIKEHGIIQPIIVKKSIKGYDIVAGERRTKASKLAGKKTIPAIVKDFTDNEMMEIALIENVQRENLSSIEEAQAYNNIINKLEITQEELGIKLGKSRSHITNMLGLLRLPTNVQIMIMNKEISMGHARVLSKLEDVEKIKSLAMMIVENRLSVRSLEDMVSRGDEVKAVPMKKNRNRKYEDIEIIMREHIGTMITISDKKITIPFDSEKDLERILDILNIDLER